MVSLPEGMDVVSSCLRDVVYLPEGWMWCVPSQAGGLCFPAAPPNNLPATVNTHVNFAQLVSAQTEQPSLKCLPDSTTFLGQ